MSRPYATKLRPRPPDKPQASKSPRTRAQQPTIPHSYPYVTLNDYAAGAPCGACHQPWKNHVEEKCLFGPTTYMVATATLPGWLLRQQENKMTRRNSLVVTPAGFLDPPDVIMLRWLRTHLYTWSPDYLIGPAPILPGEPDGLPPPRP